MKNTAEDSAAVTQLVIDKMATFIKHSKQISEYEAKVKKYQDKVIKINAIAI